MKYQIRYLPLALNDVQSIVLFNAQFSQKFQNKVVSELKSRIASLSDYPERASVYEYRPTYRKLVVLNYLVFYKLDKGKRIVEIHRVLHEARNVFDLLE
jgi:plasmid stabilization system protein ParE